MRYVGHTLIIACMKHKMSTGFLYFYSSVVAKITPSSGTDINSYTDITFILTQMGTLQISTLGVLRDSCSSS